MTRLVVVALIIAVLSSTPLATRPARASALHDFDPLTLAGYVSLRFSSAVPPNVIATVLAGEGFSQANIDLIRGSNAAVGRPSTDQGPPGLSNAQQISRDTLPCPTTDPGCELDTQAEPHIAVNPDAPGNLVAVFQQGRFPNGGSVDPGFATSFDGGKTWPYGGNAPGLTVAVSTRPTAGPGVPFERASDPVVAYDRKHKNVYFHTVAVSDIGCAIFCDSAVVVNISNNQGQTFGPPIIITEDVSYPDRTPILFNDKNWIVTDNTPTSPHYGRTYSVWDQVRCVDTGCIVTSEPVVLKYSDDGGKSWSRLIDATAEVPGVVHSEVGVQPLTLANGDVVIVYGDVQAGAYTYLGSLKAVRSTDGGAHWTTPVSIDTLAPFIEETAGLRAPNLPSATLGANDTIYVAYQDSRFSGGTKNDILLTRSTDGGNTWLSGPAIVNATPVEAVDHFTPAIAAVGTTVHLTYRTRSPGNVAALPAVDAVYRQIANGVSPGPATSLFASSNSDVAAFTTIAMVHLKFYGDYAGIAASAISAHPIWCQAQIFDTSTNPTNTHQRAFSARYQ